MINESREAVTGGTVGVCGQQFDLPKIPKGGIFLINYRIGSDSDYEIAIRFESGKIISKKLGYVTHGFSLIHDQLVIGNGDVSLKNKEIK